MFHCHENGVKTLNVEEGFLLTGKGSVRHIFCSSGGAHRKRGVFVIGGKLCISFADGIFQLRLEGSVDNPLADLRARFRKLGNIVNIRFIQQFINALVYAALVQKLVKRVGGCGETIRNGNTHSGKVSNHFTRGRHFCPQPCLHHSCRVGYTKAPAVTSHCWTSNNPFVINERFEKHISAHLSLHI